MSVTRNTLRKSHAKPRRLILRRSCLTTLADLAGVDRYRSHDSPLPVSKEHVRRNRNWHRAGCTRKKMLLGHGDPTTALNSYLRYGGLPLWTCMRTEKRAENVFPGGTA